MAQSMSGGQGGQGSGQYPLSNAEYDLIAILHNKLQAIEAYNKYLKDTKGTPELTQIIQECLKADQQFARQLHEELHRIHGGAERSR